MQHRKKKTYDKGLRSEKAAAFWLRLKGYRILNARYKTPVGEIDLIIQRNNVIAFVEVKARPTSGQALESITPMMRGRIERAASYYMAKHKVDDMALRFDVVVVCPGILGIVTIQHLDNAWQLTA